jgi:hypothetical protein
MTKIVGRSLQGNTSRQKEKRKIKKSNLSLLATSVFQIHMGEIIDYYSINLSLRSSGDAARSSVYTLVHYIYHIRTCGDMIIIFFLKKNTCVVEEQTANYSRAEII